MFIIQLDLYVFFLVWRNCKNFDYFFLVLCIFNISMKHFSAQKSILKTIVTKAYYRIIKILCNLDTLNFILGNINICCQKYKHLYTSHICTTYEG